MPVRVHSNTPFTYLNLGNGIWQSWHVFVVAFETGNIFWFLVLVFLSFFFFFHVCSFLCQGQFENLAIFFYQPKLSLAFQHSSGMLLFPLRFRLVTFVVKSQRHSVSSVLYCSLLCECFVGTWAHPST